VKRKRELEEIEKKAERDEKIEIRKKKKEEKRKKVIRERRCFVCRIFGHMARYCRNREEKEGLVWVPLNKFEVLKDRMMQRGEGSEKEKEKDKREILKEERAKKEKTKKERKERKEKKDDVKKEEKIEKEIEEREVEIRGFSRGEILRERYSLVWWRV